jgi:hypothetical protein
MYFLAAESIQRGVFPFWNPYVSCGQPFFAALQHGLLYPVSALVFLFPFEWAYKYIYIFHFMFAGLGIYIFLRQLDLHPGASLTGAVIFIFSGVMASVINLLTTLAALSWLSYVFSFFLSAQNHKDKLPWIILLALVFSMQFYAGQPEVMYMSVVAVTVFGLIVKIRIAEYLNNGKILALALSFAVLFVLIELVPFLQLLKLSHRGSFSSWAGQTVWSLYPGQLLDLAIPSFLRNRLDPGNPLVQEWLKNIYFGAGGVVLLFFGYSHRHLRRFWWAFLGVALIALFISFGSYTPFYKLLTVVTPGLKAIRYPVKFLTIFNWCLAVMAAFGMAVLVRKLEEARLKNTYLVPAMILAIFISSVYFTAGTEKLTSISSVQHKGEFKRTIDTLGLDRFAFTPRTYAVITGAAKDAPNLTATYKADDLSMWESVPNMAMVGHEFVAKGYESIYLDRFYSFYGLTSFQKGPSASRIMDLLGVKYIVSLWDINDRNLSLLKKNGWKIYRNRQVWPRVFTTEDNVRANTLVEAMQQMQEKSAGQTVPKIHTYNLHKVVIEADTLRAANLVLTDTYYPGWTATIDGKEAAVFPAYYMMRGIRMPPGKHTVVFKYLPDNFSWAALTTVCAYLFCLVYFINRGTLIRD